MKCILTLVAILFISTGIAQNTMTVSSTSVGAEQTFLVKVSIFNANLFVAFQFDLPVPAGFSYISNSVAFNSVRVSDHQLTSEMLTGSILRVIGYSLNNTPFLGDTGTIVSFQLTSGTVPGNYPLALQSSIIGDTNSNNILTGSLNGLVTLLAPDIHSNATLIDFDRTPLGQTTDRTVIIYNYGNQLLNVQNITFNSVYFSVMGNTSFSIQPTSSSSVQIRFTSLIKGVYNKIMTITSNDPDEPSVALNLHARAYAVNEIHTGNMFAYSGHGGILSFSINNMEPFIGFQFDLQLPSPLTYIPGSVVLSSRKTNHIIAANTIAGNKLRVIAYSPDKQVFTGNNGEVLSLSFTIDGVGGNYPLNLMDVIIADTSAWNCISDFYNGTLQIAAGDIFSATSLDFSNVSLLETRKETLRIHNYGSDTLLLEHITFSNNSYTLGITLPIKILVSGYVDIPIYFHQTTEGQSNGIMKVFSNDPDEYPYLVNLIAYAYIPNYLIVPDMDAVNFDTVVIPVKVTNMESFVGFQFDLNYPAYFTYVPNSAELSGRAQDHTLLSDTLDSTSVRVIAFSMSQTPFNGDTSTVVTLSFVVNALNGETTANLTLDNAVLGNVLSQNILWDTDDGIVTIIPGVPALLLLTNITVAYGENNCYEATQTIQAAGGGSTFLVENGGSAILIAGQNILFLHGTTVEPGGYLYAYITTTNEYCNSLPGDFNNEENDQEKYQDFFLRGNDTFFKIYPNPTTGIFTLELTGNTTPVMIRVDVFGLTGNIIIHEEIMIVRQLEISLLDHPPGIYIIRVISVENNVFAKVVKI